MLRIDKFPNKESVEGVIVRSSDCQAMFGTTLKLWFGGNYRLREATKVYPHLGRRKEGVNLVTFALRSHLVPVTLI